VELVKRNLRKVEISGGINLNLKVKWYWCNPPLIQSSSIFIELLVSGIASVVYELNGRQ